ncbi:MAG: hypothetical protein ACAI38_05245 [Myxococcota bacterium]
MKLLVLKVADTSVGVPWRRVRVPADIGLDDLHVVIQAVMGWDDRHAHRWKLGAARTASGGDARVDSVFSAPGVSVSYLYDERFDLTVTAETLERTEERSNDDFAVLAADADVATLNQRLRGAFFTVAYNPDREPNFQEWGDRDRVSAFEAAVMRALVRREPNQAGVQLRERTRLHCMVEELLASPSMTILRGALTRLQSQGLARAEAIDAFVALAASFPGEVTDVQEQASYLTAAETLSADSCRQTFPNGPSPVIAARLEIVGARKRNQRRRKR